MVASVELVFVAVGFRCRARCVRGLHAPRPGRSRPAKGRRGFVSKPFAGRLCPIIGASSRPRPNRRPCLVSDRHRWGCFRSVIGGWRVWRRVEGLLDAAGDRVDRLGVLANRVEGAVFAPAGDVGDRLAARRRVRRRSRRRRSRSQRAPQPCHGRTCVPEAERVRELVNERSDLAVGWSAGDDDLPTLGVAPAAGPLVGQLTDLDAVAELAAELLQRCDQVAVAVALDRLGGGRERDGLDRRAAARSSRRRRPARCGRRCASRRLPAGVLALLHGAGGEDPDRSSTRAGAACADWPCSVRGVAGRSNRPPTLPAGHSSASPRAVRSYGPVPDS